MLAPGEQIGRYRLVHPLGRGGMGVVYLAQDTILDRLIAIKGISVPGNDSEAVKQLTARILKEARTVAALNHPTIVCLYDVVIQNSEIYLVMEYVAGEALTDLFERNISVKDRFHILRNVAEALDCAHSSGVIHRDVKPGNILVTGDLNAKLTDFGIAKTLGSDTQTTAGLVLGTLGYMAPEQIKGQAVDAKSDQFSLGLVAYVFLTGKRAFEGTDIGALSYQICHVQPALPSVHCSLFDHSADEQMLRALAKDSGQRFPSCTDFIHSLQQACERHSPSPGAGSAVAEPPVVSPRSRWDLPVLWTAGIVVMIGLALAGFALFRGKSSPPPAALVQQPPAKVVPAKPPEQLAAPTVTPQVSPSVNPSVNPVGKPAKAEPRPAEILNQAKSLYNAKRYSSAIPLFKKAAQAGSMESEAYLGSLYLEGLGTDPDPAQAARYFRKAASGGEPRGMIGLAVLYEFGRGVPQNFGEAMAWYRKAADANNGTGMLNVGRLYESGKGVSQSYSEAMHWYRQAAGAGIGEAMNRIGFLYEQGLGVPKDENEAVHWYRNAAKAGNKAARANLERLGAGNGPRQ